MPKEAGTNPIFISPVVCSLGIEVTKFGIFSKLDMGNSGNKHDF